MGFWNMGCVPTTEAPAEGRRTKPPPGREVKGVRQGFSALQK